MKLTRLKLKNFRQYREASVEFQDGMTAIVGPNGSGKTTLLEAISFALFGEVRGNMDSVPHMWNESAKFEVELEFELGDTTYRAWRSDAAANLSAHTAGGWQELSRGKEDTKRKCTSLLGLTYDHFKNSFITEQKQIAFLNFESRTERAAQVAKMLGLDLLQKSEVTAKDRAREVVGQLKGMAAVLNADPKQLEKDVKDAQASVATSIKERDEAKKQFSTLSTMATSLKTKAEEAQKWLTLFDAKIALQHQIEGLKKRVDQARIELTQTEKKAAEAKSLEPDAQKYLLLEGEKKSLDAARALAADRISKVQMFEAKSKDLLDEREKLKKLIEPDLKAIQATEASAAIKHRSASEAVTSEERTWHKAQTHNEAEAKRLLSEKLRLERELATTETSLAQGICPTCGQESTGEVPLVAHLKAHLKETEKLLATNNAEAVSLKFEPKTLTQARESLKTEEATLTQAQALLRKAEVDSAAHRTQAQVVTDLETRIAKMKELLDNIPITFDEPRLKVVEVELEKLRPTREKFLSLAVSIDEAKQRAASLAKLTAEQTALHAKEGQTAEALKELSFEDKTKADEAKADYANYETKLQSAQREVIGREQILAQCQKMLEAAEKDLNEYLAIKAKTEELKKSQDLHEVTAREMRLLREKLNGELRPDLEARASENLSLLTNGRYTSLQILENFDIRVFDENAVKTTISGGEEDILALALRLALSELIQEWQGRPMSLLILDEVFSSLDSSRRQSVADRLVTLKDRFKQILVISHIEDTLQVADHCIYLSYNPHTRSTDLGDPVLNIQEALLL